MSHDVVGELVEQLTWHWENQARPRLEGLTDAEYLWEPAPGAWTIRPRDQDAPDTVTHRVGGADWLMEIGIPEPDPAPVTTIAWRIAHLVVACFGPRTQSHFGGPVVDYATWEYAPTAAAALDQLDQAYRNWIEGVRTLTEDALWRPVGPAEGPWHESPMITLVLHIHREVIHHLAEVALLRDLWAHRDGTDDNVSR